jgi:hypothetical protein
MSKIISLPNNLISTTAIVSGAGYSADPKAFFAQFRPAWTEVRSQVLKLETRQSYQQPGNPSYDALVAGDLGRAIELIPASVEGDKALYASLRERRVDFVRCRPVAYPFTPYLVWEMRHYEFNAREGERIFCCELLENEQLFADYAQHDFIVFDDSVAFVHDYDDMGGIRGGWTVSRLDHISELQRLFCWIRGRSRPFDTFASQVR